MAVAFEVTFFFPLHVSLPLRISAWVACRDGDKISGLLSVALRLRASWSVSLTAV